MPRMVKRFRVCQSLADPRRGHEHLKRHRAGGEAEKQHPAIIQLAFLAPDVTDRMLRENQPPELTSTRLPDHARRWSRASVQ
ncbi:MAG TPA: hypothetical protein VGI91_09145 [Steroidobacteraceae bacterium]|jgi:hypothetical protein